MMDKPKPASTATNQAPAGAARIAPRDEIGQLGGEERHVLECLGAAVVSVWSGLPRDIQRAIFEHAAAQQALDTHALRQQIAQFLHDHHE